MTYDLLRVFTNYTLSHLYSNTNNRSVMKNNDPLLLKS